MKKFILAAALILYSAGAAFSQTKTSRRFSLSAGISRSAPLKSNVILAAQFSGGLSLNFRLSKRWSVNAGLSKNFDDRPAVFRTGLQFRIF